MRKVEKHYNVIRYEKEGFCQALLVDLDNLHGCPKLQAFGAMARSDGQVRAVEEAPFYAVGIFEFYNERRELSPSRDVEVREANGCFSIRLERLDKLAREVRLVKKRLSDMYTVEGPDSTIGASCLRLARAIRADLILIRVDGVLHSSNPVEGAVVGTIDYAQRRYGESLKGDAEGVEWVHRVRERAA